MGENSFTAPFEEHCQGREEEGFSVKIFSDKPAIPRKKRSARVGMFMEERMIGESPLELLASVASKCSELNARLPMKKRRIKFFLSTEENRKKMKTNLNLVANEAMALKKERDENSFENSLSGSYILWEKRTGKKPEKATLKPAIEEVLPMPEALAEKIRGMGGERVQLVIQKQLHHSDINSGNSRLSIPCNQTRTEFLSESEELILGEHVPDTKRMRGIEVLVIDPRLEEMKLCLKRWTMNKTFVYNLIGKWNSLVEGNNLEAGDTIQLWVFRVKERIRRGLSDLCFALVKLEKDNNGGDDDTFSSTSTVTTHEK